MTSAHDGPTRDEPRRDVGGEEGSGDAPEPVPVEGMTPDDVAAHEGETAAEAVVAALEDEAALAAAHAAEHDDTPVATGVEIDLDAPADPAYDGAGADGAADLRDVLAAVQVERDEYLASLQRARADYDNLSKRSKRELAEALDRGAAAVVEQLLGVLDAFSYALDAAKGTEDQGLAKGVQMVHGQLVGALRAVGLEEVPGAGEPFDPNLHEALMQVEAEGDLEHPVVAEVLRTGYRFKGRVLRPASVKVAQ